jgi:23S rRNA (pseudouridine1915-N3)-methyltransferase
MKFQFWSIGKANESHVAEGIAMFSKRIQSYYSIEWKIIAPLKNAGKMQEQELRDKESEMILSHLKKEDYLVLLDERGKQLSSEDLASFIAQRAVESQKQLIFLIGGAYGVNKHLIERANFCWSLSKLVFPHQLVRLILAEQVYRACSINRNEKYHHQ